MGSASSVSSQNGEKTLERLIDSITNKKTNKESKVHSLYEILLISRKKDNRYLKYIYYYY